PLPTPIPTMTPSIITTITTASHPPIPPTPIQSKVLQNLPTFDSVFHFNERLKSLEASFSEYRQTNSFAEAVLNIPDKTILESYRDIAILKRRRGDDDDDQEGPSAGSDRGSKRRRKGGEPELASTPSESATRSESRRIIAVTDLKIVEWHNYNHLDWISVRRDDDKIYKFKEGKLSNLTVEERFAFNVSLRMFTRSIIIQRCVEDLQLRVKSYQKRLNLTKPDTYRSDLKRREAYTA
nr:hypothetical protein [Tanacetum cinerariifolium]